MEDLPIRQWCSSPAPRLKASCFETQRGWVALASWHLHYFVTGKMSSNVDLLKSGEDRQLWEWKDEGAASFTLPVLFVMNLGFLHVHLCAADDSSRQLDCCWLYVVSSKDFPSLYRCPQAAPGAHGCREESPDCPQHHLPSRPHCGKHKSQNQCFPLVLLPFVR